MGFSNKHSSFVCLFSIFRYKMGVLNTSRKQNEVSSGDVGLQCSSIYWPYATPGQESSWKFKNKM